jgi:hypothetical protein
MILKMLLPLSVKHRRSIRDNHVDFIGAIVHRAANLLQFQFCRHQSAGKPVATDAILTVERSRNFFAILTRFG